MAAFILIVITFAIINGIAKTFSLGKFFSQSVWDSKSPFISVLETSPPSIFIFQKDPERIGVFKLDENAHLASGVGGGLEKTADIFEKESGEEITRILAFNFGVDIENFAAFDNNVSLDRENAGKLFKNFASFATPLKIISGTYKKDLENTNITRIDLLKLWWQVKGVRAEKVEIVELSPYKEEIAAGKNKKVLGVDEESIRSKMAEFLENRYLDQNKTDIELVNGSDVSGALGLAADFASSAGFSPVQTEQATELSEKTQIIAKDENSYNVSYLASIFDCDIVSEQNEAEGSDIKVVIGRDFASKYFE